MLVRPRVLRRRRANWFRGVRLGAGRAFFTSFLGDYVLGDQYRNPWKEFRIGKLVEDVDALAGPICCYKKSVIPHNQLHLPPISHSWLVILELGNQLQLSPSPQR